MNALPYELEHVLGEDAWRLTPATFACKVSYGSWIPAKHLMYISAIIAHELAKGDARIVVSIPPRHGKSELLSVYTPAWYLDQYPQNRVIMASYGADLIEEFSQRTRDLIQEHGDSGLLNVKVRSDKSRVDHWATTAGGQIYAIGVGGAITGRGANLILVDDYIKNAKEAVSQAQRDDIYTWFTTVLMTRLHKGGSVIIIATRWDTDDLIGRLPTIGGKPWKTIKLPAIAEVGDPLGRQVGQPLWEEKYDLGALEELQAVLGSYWFSALYQQDPLHKDALKKGTLRMVDYLPNIQHLRKVRYWDFAGSENAAADWTTGALLVEDLLTGLVYFAHLHRVQKSPGDVEQLVAQTATIDGYDTEIVIEQEPGSSGKSVVDYYRRRILRGYKVHADRPTGSKPVRAQPFLAAIEAQTVFMLKGEWNKDFLEELKTFPSGEHDDQVDAAAGAYKRLLERSMSQGAVWGRPQVAGPQQPLVNKYTSPETRKAARMILGATFGR